MAFIGRVTDLSVASDRVEAERREYAKALFDADDESRHLFDAPRSRSTPCGVFLFSPARARRTTIRFSASVARSKACRGWPVSWSTKFVMSATLLMGRWPMACKRRASHSGDGPIFTPRTTRAA